MNLNGRFEIYLRRRQNRYTFPNTTTQVDVTVQCDPSTGYAQYVAGAVDNTTAYAGIIPVGGWYDFTAFIEGAQDLSFTWDKTNTGDSSNSSTSQDGSNYDKGITSDLLFFDSAFQFIYDWLLKTECSILNSVEVKIVDLVTRGAAPGSTGVYRIFEIKSDNLEYAPVDEPCQFSVKLREQDNNWHCIHKTVIWDNWQNWFKDDSLKEHPCFLTCIEPRPRLVQSARMALMIFLHSNPTGAFIDLLTGNHITVDARPILNANRFVDAPLIRTYIENVAGKCNLTMDTMFDVGQELENLCLYYPQAGFMYEDNSDNIRTDKLAFHYDNRWLITMAELLDKLKVVCAAEWYVTPLNKLVFKPIKDLINLAPIYDFTAPGAEPIYDLRYSFNGDKKPAYGRYEYQDDGSDLASQEVSTLYNDIVDYDGPANNPMLEGEKVKNFEFAPTGFIRDGRSKDYLHLLIKDGGIGASILVGLLFTIASFFIAATVTIFAAPIVIVVGGIFFAIFFAWFGLINVRVNALMNEFVNHPEYSGAVRLTSEQVLTPRLILWDGVSLNRAKAVHTIGLPSPNLYYNPDGIRYDKKNDIDTDNLGHTIYNYPMYFDGDFYGNMYPKYHDIIDNPLKSLETHQDVKWDVDLCEAMLNLFGVFQNQYAQIGKVVKLEHRDGYDVYVRIGNINVDYENGKINLKGTVLRRRAQEFQPETTIPVGPGGGGGIEETFPVGGDFPEGPAPVGPHEETICLKWVNHGTETAIGVHYLDCFNTLVVADIVIDEEFCAISIIDAGIGGNIVATDRCDHESGSGSVTIDCFSFQNITAKVAHISYIDCDGNAVSGTVMPNAHFCARSITDFGSCGGIVQIGLCDCEESGAIFPIRDSDDTMVIDSDGTIIIWQ